MKKTRIILFGTGALSKFLTEKAREDVEIVAYLLKESSGGELNGRPVISLDMLKNTEYDYIVVAFGDTPMGIKALQAANVPDDKIVGYAYSGLSYKDSILQQRCEKFNDLALKNEKIPELFHLPAKKYYLCGMNIPERTSVIERDYIREQTLAFLAEEIYRKNIVGSVAEIGVSAGIFARKINELFPDRTLYLFDTFEGLPDEERKSAERLGWGEKLYALNERGTAMENVLEYMPYREKCIVKKGVFPHTFDIYGRLAFVSLDIDFYDTTRQGLEIIYPHLSKGGYIMVHDYHNLSFVETKQAVIDFCDMNDVSYVPIPDAGGSVVLVK